MRCKFCGFTNGEDDHRCLRCGRRAGTAISAPASFSGANALAFAPALDPNQTQELPAPPPTAAAQSTLFPPPGQKVIPFDQLQRHVTGRLNLPFAMPVSPAQPAERPAPQPRTRRVSAPAAEQTSIDFFKTPASAQRMLKTAVPAQIYCDFKVATPTHRLIAGAMDAAMILLAFGLFVEIAQFAGGSFGEGKSFWVTMGAAFTLISAFYGILWMLADRETAGMNWTELQLVTFDGFTIDRRARAIRFASTWLSFGAGGAGIFWTVADEEKLAWHDHMSKTFPTFRRPPLQFQPAGRLRAISPEASELSTFAPR